MQPEHTKGEWWIQVWNEGSSYESVHINPPLGGNDSHAVAVLSGPDAKANARHIVKCVNNHDRLVKALRVALELADDHPSMPSTGHIHAILDELENDQ